MMYSVKKVETENGEIKWKVNGIERLFNSKQAADYAADKRMHTVPFDANYDPVEKVLAGDILHCSKF